MTDYATTSTTAETPVDGGAIGVAWTQAAVFDWGLIQATTLFTRISTAIFKVAIRSAKGLVFPRRA